MLLLIFHQKYWELLAIPYREIIPVPIAVCVSTVAKSPVKMMQITAMMYWETVGSRCSKFTLFTVVLASVQCTVLEMLLFQIIVF